MFDIIIKNFLLTALILITALAPIDHNSGYVEFTYDGFGRRIGINDQRHDDDCIGGITGYTRKISFAFNPLDRLIEVINQHGYSTTYDWRADGQRSQIKITPDWAPDIYYHVEYAYDSVGRLQTVTEPPTTNSQIATFEYDNNGNRDSLTYHLDAAHDAEIQYSYNRDNLLTAFSTSHNAAGNLDAFDLSNVTVDGLGRLTDSTETLTKTDGNTVTHVHDYTYDRMSQLKTADITNINQNPWSAAYTYHDDGNLDLRTIQGTDEDFGYDAGNLLTDVGSSELEWDQNGNLLEGVSYDQTWNWDNKLRSAIAGDYSISLKYDSDGNRIYKRIDETGQYPVERIYFIDYAADLPVILMELTASHFTQKTYIYAHNQILAQHDGYFTEDKFFYLHDRLGSIRQVIDVNADVKWLYTYGPFGKTLESDDDGDPPSNPFQFVGQYYDQEIEQYYLRARQYDPYLSRFTSIDPILGNFNEPLTLHQYLYCLNDPVNRTDLTGEFSLVDMTYSMGRYASMTLKAYDVGDRALSLAKMVVQGASVQSIMTTIAIEMVTDKVGGKLFDRWAGGVTRRFNKRMGKQLPGRYTKMGLTSNKKGHHLIPEWLGGDATQLTARLNKKQHDLLEAKIRKRMKKYSFSIGGSGNTTAKTFDKIAKSGDLGNVMEDLLDIYKDFDRTHGTSLSEGFMINMLGGAGDDILEKIGQSIR